MPDPLSDDAVVVRGGQSRSADGLVQKLEDNLEDHGMAALSIYAVEENGRTYSEAVLAASVCGDVPHGQIQVSRMGTLRAAGFGRSRTPATDSRTATTTSASGTKFGPTTLNASSGAFMGRYRTQPAARGGRSDACSRGLQLARR